MIRHIEGTRISVGEPGGSRSERVKAIADALVRAGFRCPVTTSFRHEVGVKLLDEQARPSEAMRPEGVLT